MIRSAVLAVVSPLARSTTRLSKHNIRPAHLRLISTPLQKCRCLSLSATHHKQSQHNLDTPSSASQSDSNENRTSTTPQANNDPATLTTSRDIKEHLDKLSDTEREEFAKAELAKLNEVDQKRLRVLEMEYDVWMSTGAKVPEHVSDALWLQLLHTPSRHGRNKLYTYWFKRHWKERNDEVKRQKRQEKHAERQEEKRKMLEELGRQQGLPEGEIPFKNTFMMFLRPQTMLKHYYNNMCWAMRFGQPLVMDLSLEQHMKDRERTSLIKQLLNVHGVNKIRTEPFNLVMTGLNPDGFIQNKLKPLLGDEETLPMTITSQDYLDMFPAERLVYLTPNSPNELLTWNPDDVYIIGGLVDLADEKPITFAKARRQNIRTARLPLDRFLMWQQGGKAMTLDILMKVLCEVKDHGDWPTALKHIPGRKAQIRPQYTNKSSPYYKSSQYSNKSSQYSNKSSQYSNKSTQYKKKGGQYTKKSSWNR